MLGEWAYKELIEVILFYFQELFPNSKIYLKLLQGLSKLPDNGNLRRWGLVLAPIESLSHKSLYYVVKLRGCCLKMEDYERDLCGR